MKQYTILNYYIIYSQKNQGQIPKKMVFDLNLYKNGNIKTKKSKAPLRV